jgi:putative CocE/NonD family hydrolase
MSELRIIRDFPRRSEEIENTWIPLNDGTRLAARIWLPLDAADRPVPAILEYLPYRKRDGTAARDAHNHAYFAGHGYACVRVDIRGNGDSEGLMWDEYLQQEQNDALEVIAWIAAQPWCDGKVGMMGISWGGFNALQVAARRPPALKAIITVCSTDDRYADDIHYKGGALLVENLGWACTMFAYSSRPPDPVLAGDRWRDMWIHRLENTPLLIENWLNHQHRDSYWRHGSVCEDFNAINAAVFAVGGWADAYSNAVPRLLSGIQAPVRGLIGPWIHEYPHLAIPRPVIGFLQESLRWWDQWLKGIDTGIMNEPLYRAYLMESALPTASYKYRDGRWIAESNWPSSQIRAKTLAMNPGRLEADAAPEEVLTVCSPQDTGAGGGEYCAMWPGPEGPKDQREDDAGSLVFDSPPLDQRLEIFGAPIVSLELSVDRHCAFVAVRLCDVWPDGDSARATYGILNLAHRESHASPTPLVPGKRYQVRIQLDDIAYAFPLGHCIRVAISTAYWPMIWPSPQAVTLRLYTGQSKIELPIRPPREESLRPFDPAEAAPLMASEVLRPKSNRRTVERNVTNGETITRVLDDAGEHCILPHRLTTSETASEVYRIKPDDPLSAHAKIHWTQTLSRDNWQVRIETHTEMWANTESFFIRAHLEAFDGNQQVFSRHWDRQIARDLV